VCDNHVTGWNITAGPKFAGETFLVKIKNTILIRV
jgi:hypothetical protein